VRFKTGCKTGKTVRGAIVQKERIPIIRWRHTKSLRSRRRFSTRTNSKKMTISGVTSESCVCVCVCGVRIRTVIRCTSAWHTSALSRSRAAGRNISSAGEWHTLRQRDTARHTEKHRQRDTKRRTETYMGIQRHRYTQRNRQWDTMRNTMVCHCAGMGQCIVTDSCSVIVYSSDQNVLLAVTWASTISSALISSQ